MTGRPLGRLAADRGGVAALLALGLVVALAALAPLWVGDRALLLVHDGGWSLPVLGGYHPAADLGQRRAGEVHWRSLRERPPDGVLVVLPPYPYGPNESLLTDPSLPGPPPHAPSREHWMGTDDRARDVFARVVYGARTSLAFGGLVVLLAYGGGALAGVALGWRGGRTDLLGVRLVEIWSGVPALYAVMLLGSVLRPSLPLLALVLASFRWMGISFLVRAEALRERDRDYAVAAEALGLPARRVLLRHVLPNCLGPVWSLAPLAFASAVLSMVALDFLGFGLRPPTPSWGELVRQGLRQPAEWHLVVFPFLAMFGTLLLVVRVGEALRRAFDPRG